MDCPFGPRLYFSILIRALSLLCLGIAAAAIIFAAAWPGLGPAWHVDTAWGAAIGLPSVRLGMAGLASLTSLLVLVECGLSRSWRPAKGFLAAIAPALIAVFPAPFMSLDTSLLRSERAIARLEAQLPIAAVETPAAVPMPPSAFVWLAAKMADRKALVALTEAAQPNPAAPTSVPDGAVVSALQVQIAALTAQLGKASRCPMKRDQEEVDELCVKQVDEQNAGIFAQIKPLQAKRDAQRAADLKTARDTADAEARRHDLGVAIAIHQDRIFAWSLPLVFVEVVILAFFALFTGWVWALPLVVAVLVGGGLALPLDAAWAMPPFAVGQLTPAPRLFILAGFAAAFSAFLVARCLRLVVNDNRDLWKLLSPSRRQVILARATLLWLPLGAAVLLGITFAARTGGAIEDVAYNIDIRASGLPKPPNACLDEVRLIYETGDCSRALEADIETAVHHWFAESMRLAQEGTAQAQEQTQAAALSTGSLALQIFESTVPHRLAKRPLGKDERGISDAFNHDVGCPWWNIVCNFKRKVKIAADDAYAAARTNAHHWLARRVKELEHETTEASQLAKTAVDNAGVAALNRLEGEVVRTLWASFRGGDVLNFASALLLVIAILKSAGFVLGRVAFAHGRLNRQIASGQRRRDAVLGPGQEAARVSDGPRLPLQAPGLYRLIWGAQADGVSPKGLVLWQPHRQAIKRLVPMRHVFQIFSSRADQPGVALIGRGTEHLIEIVLVVGESVCFRPSALHAALGPIRLGSRWSFRIGDLMQGRIRVTFAEGPGILVLKSRDRPTVLGPEAGTQGIRPSRLIAWTDGADFWITADKGWLAVYSSDVLYKPAGTGLAVFDGDTGGSRLVGAIRFLPILLLPF